MAISNFFYVKNNIQYNSFTYFLVWFYPGVDIPTNYEDSTTKETIWNINEILEFCKFFFGKKFTFCDACRDQWHDLVRCIARSDIYRYLKHRNRKNVRFKWIVFRNGICINRFRTDKYPKHFGNYSIQLFKVLKSVRYVVTCVEIAFC